MLIKFVKAKHQESESFIINYEFYSVFPRKETFYGILIEAFRFP